MLKDLAIEALGTSCAWKSCKVTVQELCRVCKVLARKQFFLQVLQENIARFIQDSCKTGGTSCTILQESGHFSASLASYSGDSCKTGLPGMVMICNLFQTAEFGLSDSYSNTFTPVPTRHKHCNVPVTRIKQSDF